MYRVDFTNHVLRSLNYNRAQNTNIWNDDYFDFDQNGNLIINHALSGGGNTIWKYQLSPMLIIPAGSTSGTLQLNGIEDDLNAPGEEEDETIVVEITSASNVILNEDSEIEDIVLTI